jgi:hypothetical protein
MKLAVVQDIGTGPQNVLWETDDEDAATDFAARVRRQFPDHTWTVHPLDEATDTTISHQIGEDEVPLRLENAVRFVCHG